MPSTYSTNFRFELIGSGEQQGTWGTTTNTNLGTLIEEAIGGYVTVTVADSALGTTLTANNGTSDQSRNMIINLTSAGNLTATREVFCPAIEKLYVVRNATTNNFPVTFRVANSNVITHPGVSIPNGSTYLLYADGTDVKAVNGTIASQNANSVSITGGSIVANASSLGVRDSDGSHVLSVAAGSNLTANRVLTLTTGDVDRTLDISASNVTVTVAGAALIDDADAAAQRTTLGLGTVATQNANNVAITGGSITGITDLALADGGTGASLSDPNADAILGWNDTANVMRFFTAGTGITINATSNTIAATGPSTANVQTFNSSNTWSKPSGVFSTYRVQIWGGGGSGGKGSSGGGSLPGSGGGGGGYWEWTGPISDLANTETVTVGLGGAAQTSSGTAGNSGGTSSFTATNRSTTYTVYGGSGGNGSGAAGGGGGSITSVGGITGQRDWSGGADAGSGGTSTSLNGGRGATGGGGGAAPAGADLITAGIGGEGGWGGGGGGSGGWSASWTGAGGTSRYGGSGGAGAAGATNATAGSAPGGGGGGGGRSTGNSGAGADGRVVVTVW